MPVTHLDLYRIKPAFVAVLEPLTARLAVRGVHPDRVTDMGMVLGVAAGGAMVAGAVAAPAWWAAVLPLQVARLAANAIDGRLARLTGTATGAGAVRNEVADRVGDLASLAGAAAVAPVAAVIATVVVLLGEWAATLDWALGGERRFVGPGGKPDRAVLLGLGAVVGVFVGGVAVEAACIAIAALAGIGLVVRLRAAAGTTEVAR